MSATVLIKFFNSNKFYKNESYLKKKKKNKLYLKGIKMVENIYINFASFKVIKI